jgi:hypothetical protein
MKSQERCEITLTERYENASCRCTTYDGNLGPCLTYEEGANHGHCVYCDHERACHLELQLAAAALLDERTEKGGER